MVRARRTFARGLAAAPRPRSSRASALAFARPEGGDRSLRGYRADGGAPVSGPLALLKRFRPLPSPFRVLRGFALFNLAAPLRRTPVRPRALCVYVTYRCNLRCQMPHIWRLPVAERAGEWTPEQLDGILRDRLFSEIEFANLNGGEPTLRRDLVRIAEVALDRLPRLRNLTLNTNGTPPERCVANCAEILERCRRRSIRFGVSVSLHRLGAAYDDVAGVPGAFDRVMATLEGLEALRDGPGFFLSTNCVLTPETVDGAEAMLRWGQERGIPVNFTVAEVRERFNNADGETAITFDEPEARRKLVAFLRRLSRERRQLAQHSIRYGDLADMLEHGARRRLSCHYALAGVIVGWDGTLYYCKKSAGVGSALEAPAADVFFAAPGLAYRRNLLASECASCLPNTFNSIEMQKDLWRLAALLR